MLNSSKRNRLRRVEEYLRSVNERQTGVVGNVALLKSLIEAQKASIAHLVATRARPEAERLAMCSPPESAARIFGNMAMDLQIVEERRKLKEWVDELELAKGQARTRRISADN